MKGKIVLAVSGVLVVGTVGYVVYKHLRYSKKDNSNDVQVTKENNNCVATEDIASTCNENYSSTKDSTISLIKERHIAASRIIEESLQNIFKNDDEDDKDEFDEKIDQELDALLK